MARPRVHLAASLGLVALQYWRTRRVLPSLSPLLSGFLIDADHLVDHRLHRLARDGAPGRLVLPLHGWEYLPLVGWLEPRLLGSLTERGLTLGMLLHLAIDQTTNPVESPLTYSILYRAARGFRGAFFTGAAGQHAWRDTPVWQIWRWL